MTDNGGDSDYTEMTCCKCGVLHWIPKGLWQTCVATKNDPAPHNAYCPYGHPYVARRDQPDAQGKLPTPPPLIPPEVVKRPKRFWQLPLPKLKARGRILPEGTQDEEESNVIPLKKEDDHG